MSKRTSDPRFPDTVDYDSIYKLIDNVTPGDTTFARRQQLVEKATEAFRKNELWTAPNGVRCEAIRHPRELATYGEPLRCQIVGYRKLRDNEWFIAKDGEVLYGPMRTKRGCLSQVHAKRGKVVEAGWYTAKGHDIFTRAMAEKVLGRKLTEEER